MNYLDASIRGIKTKKTRNNASIGEFDPMAIALRLKKPLPFAELGNSVIEVRFINKAHQLPSNSLRP